MYILYIITGLTLFISLMTNRQKTFAALKIAYKKMMGIIPAFLSMLILISIVLYFVPDHVIIHYLGKNDLFGGVVLAALFGSVTLMPGFITFPLCGILLEKGVSYTVLSAFTTTLMMVGILTFPIEKEYFGTKVTVIRNAISLMIALIVALSIGYFFGELI